MDAATLGGGLAATKISEAGGKEALKLMGKTALIDFTANTGAAGVGELGKKFDWPLPITIMLSLTTGITVSIHGTKLLFKGEGFQKKIPWNEAKGGSKTGTIWDNITGTADNMTATDIPTTFKIDLDKSISYANPKIGTNTLWANSNATKHMGEYVSRFGDESWSIGTRSQVMLESYSASLNKAMNDLANKNPGRYFNTYGNWEFGINTETGVVYHARMIN